MPIERDPAVLARLKRNLFFLIVAGVTMAFLSLIGDFLLTIFWAAVIAIIFFDPYRRLVSTLKGRTNLAASLMTILVLLFVIVPMFFLSLAIIKQATEIMEGLKTEEMDLSLLVDYLSTKFPDIFSLLSRYDLGVEVLKSKLNDLALTAAQTVGGKALSFSGSLLNFFVQFTLMLYLLFFFFRDGASLVRAMINAFPMGNVKEKRLFSRFAEVSKATLKGTLIVAVVQGGIGGILFASVGIPAALLWGVAMTFLALLPVGGSGIVWGPAAIIFFAQGDIVRGLVVLIVGSLIIGLIDNLLRPLLVGRETGMPDYLVLLSTLGGITWFGITGFILGPIIAALFVTSWEMLGKQYGGKAS